MSPKSDSGWKSASDFVLLRLSNSQTRPLYHALYAVSFRQNEVFPIVVLLPPFPDSFRFRLTTDIHDFG